MKGGRPGVLGGSHPTVCPIPFTLVLFPPLYYGAFNRIQLIGPSRSLLMTSHLIFTPILSYFHFLPFSFFFSFLPLDFHHFEFLIILFNFILVHSFLISNVHYSDYSNMVLTSIHFVPIWTEHLPSEEWRGNFCVARSKLMPDLLWLRRDSEDQWKKAFVFV